MNSCAEFRQEMLSAELIELRGEGDTPLALHVRSCAACRAHAGRMLAGYGEIDRGLGALSAERSPAVIPLRRRRLLWAAVPLSAAAVLALLLMPQRTEQAPRVDVIAGLLLPEDPIVTPQAGQQAVLFEQTDMTIVWLYNQETP